MRPDHACTTRSPHGLQAPSYQPPCAEGRHFLGWYPEENITAHTGFWQQLGCRVRVGEMRLPPDGDRIQEALVDVWFVHDDRDEGDVRWTAVGYDPGSPDCDETVVVEMDLKAETTTVLSRRRGPQRR